MGGIEESRDAVTRLQYDNLQTAYRTKTFPIQVPRLWVTDPHAFSARITAVLPRQSLDVLTRLSLRLL